MVKPERADRNVNIEELLFFTRNQAGWLQSRFRVGGTIDLLKQFLAAGIPVMIEEGTYLDGPPNWPNDDRWAGHYLLLTSYDDGNSTFTGQDTLYGPDRALTYEELDQNWKAYNRVYLLLYHSSQEEVVKAILGQNWDPDYNRQVALDTAQSEIDADPTDVFAWFNLGSNLNYFERYEEAGAAYDESSRLGWPQRMLRYQFGPYIAYFHSGRTEDLIALLDYNLKRITPNSEEAYIWRGWALYRLGDIAGAIESFRRAYEENYTSVDAKYALESLGASP
jgi:tetratricopeptide (TPR) repeat protein